MNDLEQAIVKTITWFDIFDTPMTDREIWRYLWFPSLFDKEGVGGRSKPHRSPVDASERTPLLSKERVSYEKIRNTLAAPSDWLGQRIEHDGAWYFLNGKGWLVERRHRQHVMFRQRWRKASKMARRAGLVPYLKTFAMCNTFALENSKATSDLDTFVIAKSERLWLVRLLLTSLTFFSRKWRHGSRIANRFCLSFYITEQQLNLSIIAQKPYDIYLVYWLAFLAPLYGKETAKIFFKQNAWLQTYLPNCFPRDESRKYTARPGTIRRSGKKILEFIFGGPVGNLAEKAASSLQRRYMQRHAHQYPEGAVVVNDNMLKFHNEDRREHFRKLWENKVNAILS